MNGKSEENPRYGGDFFCAFPELSLRPQSVNLSHSYFCSLVEWNGKEQTPAYPLRVSGSEGRAEARQAIIDALQEAKRDSSALACAVQQCDNRGTSLLAYSIWTM